MSRARWHGRWHGSVVCCRSRQRPACRAGDAPVLEILELNPAVIAFPASGQKSPINRALHGANAHAGDPGSVDLQDGR